MTPFHFVDKYKSFGGICCLNLQGKGSTDSFKDREAQKLLKGNISFRADSGLHIFSFGIAPSHNFLH